MKRIILVAVLALVVVGAGFLLLVPRSRAQVELTLEPSMTKGAAAARVTIVEFSDYQ